MSTTDLSARLFVMAEDTASEIDGAIQRIARQMSAKGLLGSGNFFIAIKDELVLVYGKALNEMSEYALRVASPGQAAASIREYGAQLESAVTRKFESVLAGEANGMPLTGNGADRLSSELARSLRNNLNAAIFDTENNVKAASAGSRGAVAFFRKHGWNIFNSMIALAALYLAYTKK